MNSSWGWQLGVWGAWVDTTQGWPNEWDISSSSLKWGDRHEYAWHKAHHWRQNSAVVKHEKRWQVIISHFSACDLTNNQGSNSPRMGKQVVNSLCSQWPKSWISLLITKTKPPPNFSYGEMVNLMGTEYTHCGLNFPGWLETQNHKRPYCPGLLKL